MCVYIYIYIRVLLYIIHVNVCECMYIYIYVCMYRDATKHEGGSPVKKIHTRMLGANTWAAEATTPSALASPRS